MKPVLVEKYVDVRRRPQPIARQTFHVKPIVHRTMQVDEQDFKLLTNIRHLYVPRCLISIIFTIIYLNCTPSNFTGNCRQVPRPDGTPFTSYHIIILNVVYSLPLQKSQPFS